MSNHAFSKHSVIASTPHPNHTQPYRRWLPSFALAACLGLGGGLMPQAQAGFFNKLSSCISSGFSLPGKFICVNSPSSTATEEDTSPSTATEEADPSEPSLADIVADNRDAFIADLTQAVSDEASTSGVSVLDDEISSWLSWHMDDLIEGLEPFYQAWVDGGKSGTFGSALTSQASNVADAMLAVTDQIADDSESADAVLYQTFRSILHDYVVDSIPAMGTVADTYIEYEL